MREDGRRIVSASSVLMLVLLGLAVLAPSVSAGFIGDVPVKPFEANKLNAMAKQMNAVEDKIKAVLGMPPDDIIPNPEGLVRMFDATADHLGAINDRLEDVSISPDDVTPGQKEDLIVALNNVLDGAQGIVETVDALSPGPDEMPNVAFALGEIKTQATVATTHAESMLELLGPSDVIP